MGSAHSWPRVQPECGPSSGLWWVGGGVRRARTQQVTWEVSLGFRFLSTGPLPPCLLLLALESQSPPGMKFAKAYFGSIAGKIFPQGRRLPWDYGKSLTLRT